MMEQQDGQQSSLEEQDYQGMPTARGGVNVVTQGVSNSRNGPYRVSVEHWRWFEKWDDATQFVHRMTNAHQIYHGCSFDPCALKEGE